MPKFLKKTPAAVQYDLFNPLMQNDHNISMTNDIMFGVYASGLFLLLCTAANYAQ